MGARAAAFRGLAAAQKEKIAALRTLGKREIAKRLEIAGMPAKASRRRAVKVEKKAAPAAAGK